MQSNQIKPNIMTLDKMQQNERSDPTKGMTQQRRPMKESEDEVLKKMAHAEAVNKGLVKAPMGTV